MRFICLLVLLLFGRLRPCFSFSSPFMNHKKGYYNHGGQHIIDAIESNQTNNHLVLRKDDHSTSDLIKDYQLIAKEFLLRIKHELGPLLQGIHIVGYDRGIARVCEKVLDAVVKVEVLVPSYKVTCPSTESRRWKLKWPFWKKEEKEDERKEEDWYYTIDPPRVNETQSSIGQKTKWWKCKRSPDPLPIVEQAGYCLHTSGCGVYFHQGDGQFFVATNYHVSNGTNIEGTIFGILFPGSKDRFMAKFVGCDMERDIAVLKVPILIASLYRLPKPIRFGCSRFLRVGQACLGIRYNYLDQPVITKGIVTAVDQHHSFGDDDETDFVPGCVDSNAECAPGSSGGPLVDAKGRLIGLMKGSCPVSSTAIPSDTVRRSVKQILEYGTAVSPRVGLILNEDAELLDTWSGSAAARAGLDAYSARGGGNYTTTIVRVDGKPIRERDDILSILDSKDLGTTVFFTLKVATKEGKEGLMRIPLKVESRTEEVAQIEKLFGARLRSYQRETGVYFML